MPGYDFDSITVAQAVGFRAGVDTLAFRADVTPAQVSIIYRTGSGPQVVIGDRTVSFGTGMLGASFTLAGDAMLYIGATGSETNAGGAGDDHLYGGDGADTLFGQGGADILHGGAGGDSLNGGAGDDIIEGGDGTDTLDGGEGFDLLSFRGSAAGVQASVAQGADDDRISSFEGLEGSAFADRLTGDAQDNLLRGGNGSDTLVGLTGNDTLEGGRGDDLIDGGAGRDIVVYTNPTSGVFVNLETRNAISFDTLQGQDTLVDVEGAIGGAFNDVMLGDSGDNLFVGLAGADSLNGGGGADTLRGGDGADTLTGGAGEDWLVGGAGADLMDAGADLDIIEIFPGDSPGFGLVTERDRVRGFGDDVLVFRGGVTPTEANYVELTIGLANVLDKVQELYAQGYEYIAIQLGANIEVFAPRVGAGVTLENASLDKFGLINIRNEAPQWANLNPSSGDDLIVGVGDETIDGLAGADTIIEASGTNYLRGGDGSDFIVGGSGFDDINGNIGNDTCVGGDGDDWVVGGKDNDSLIGGAGQDLVYGNLGNDTCEGGDGADTVRGGQGDDVIAGGAGNDYMSGDRGNDTVSGGAGADIFHSFNEADIDRVTDFNAAEGDRVQLDPGTHYQANQVGSDTVISLGGGGQMILVGVQLSTLPAGWLFGV